MKNISIGTKIMGVVALLALIAVTATGFAAYRMAGISEVYSALLSGPAKEAVAIPRANRALAQTRADVLALVAETSAERISALSEQLEKDAAQYHKFIDAAKAARPEDAAKLEAFAAEYDRL